MSARKLAEIVEKLASARLWDDLQAHETAKADRDAAEAQLRALATREALIESIAEQNVLSAASAVAVAPLVIELPR